MCVRDQCMYPFFDSVVVNAFFHTRSVALKSAGSISLSLNAQSTCERQYDGMTVCVNDGMTVSVQCATLAAVSYCSAMLSSHQPASSSSKSRYKKKSSFFKKSF